MNKKYNFRLVLPLTIFSFLFSNVEIELTRTESIKYFNGSNWKPTDRQNFDIEKYTIPNNVEVKQFYIAKYGKEKIELPIIVANGLRCFVDKNRDNTFSEKIYFIHPSNTPLGKSGIINLDNKFPKRETLSILGGFMLEMDVFRGNPHIYAGEFSTAVDKIEIGVSLTYDGFDYTDPDDIQIFVDADKDGLFSEDELRKTKTAFSVSGKAYKLNRLFTKDEKLVIDLLPSDDNIKIPVTGFPLPEFKLTSVKNGNTYRISEIIGDILVLNFWGISCMPCRMEIPYLNKLKKDFDNHTFFEFDVNTMTVDNLDSMIPYKARFIALAPYDSLENIRKFTTEELPFEYEQFIISEETMEILNLKSIPYNLVVDENGVIQLITSGFGPGAEEQLITKLKNKIEGRE